MSAVSNSDLRRLGPDVAAIKAKTDPKRWHALVQYAHSRGFAVGGVLSGVPDALKPRLQSSIKSEAQRTIADAYRPAEQNLASEQSRLTAIADRRRTDEQAFNNWAQTQRDSLMTQARAADGVLAQRRTDILAAAQHGLAQTQEAARQDAGNQPGRVSDPNQSRTLDLSGPQGVNQAQLAAVDLQQAGGQQGSDRLAQLSVAAQGFAKMSDAAREAASQQDIRGLTQSQQDLAGAKAKDYLSVFGGLKSAETDKASANQDRLVAASKLGVEQATLDNQIVQQNRDFGLKTKKFNLDTWMAQHQNSVDTAKVQLGYDQIAARKGTAAADRALRKQLGEQAHRDRMTKLAQGDTGSPADRKNSTNQASTVATIVPIIKDLHKKKVPGSRIRQHVMDRTKNGVSDIQIDVAEDLRHNQGKLSARGRRKAKALGISTATMKNLGWI